MASPEGGEAIVRTAVERFGRLDAVVSNAGHFQQHAFDELSADDWRKMLSVHLDGGFYLSQPAYKVMKEQRYGRFVFISSSGGMFGQPLESHYAAAKAGLVGLSNVIAIEGAEHGILSNTVLPFGFSRMVTETVGDPEALKQIGFLGRDQARARGAHGRLPGESGLRVQPPELLGLCRSFRAGLCRPRPRLVRRERQQPDCRRHRGPSVRGVGDRAVHRAGSDLRGSLRRRRAARSDDRVMDIDYLLTATRSARKSLDLDAPVDLDDIRECLRIGLQAANGSNQQSWRWLVVADLALREQDRRAVPRGLPAPSRRADALADLMPAGTPEGRLMSSTEWLVENMARVPLLVIPCYEAIPAAHRRRRVVSSGDAVRLDLPAGVELSSWPCTPAATAPASRRCTCTAKTSSGNCSGSHRPMSRAVCCPWAACAAGTPSAGWPATSSKRSVACDSWDGASL